MKIIVDGMGGDNAPVEIVKGAIDALKEYNIDLIIVGKRHIINEELKKYDYPVDRVEVLDAEDIITNDDDPALAIRRKKNSSIVVGMKALSNGKGDGFVSAGSTGALLAGGQLIVKRIEGIDRAALTSVYPTSMGLSLLVDAGANTDSKPEYLQQFALMGSIYMEKVMGVTKPRVGLANIGTEEGKGNELAKTSYDLMKNLDINFIGNIEGRTMPLGVADVIVADGFVGNMILKVTEGVAISLFKELKEVFMTNSKTKIGALLLKSNLKFLKGKLDYTEYGGAPLLGTKKPIVKAHGSSNAYAYKNAINQALKFIEKDVIKTIEENINLNRQILN